MKYLYIKEKNKIFKLNLKEIEFFRLKSLFLNKNINKNIRNDFYLKYLKYSKYLFPTKVKNRCNLNYTSKSVNKFFRISRNIYKKLRRNGYICGITNSSW